MAKALFHPSMVPFAERRNMNMFNRIYCVPTHRKMDHRNIHSYFNEVKYANTKFSQDILLVFFEDQDEKINLEDILYASQNYSDVKYLYITRNEIKNLLDLIYRKLPRKSKAIFKKIYPGENVNYGNIFNRIFIFAILVGADFIHRRDSDIQIDIDSNNRRVYPIDTEIVNLGRETSDGCIYICGGGYKGKYNIDIEGLIKDNGKDYSLVKQLFSCMSIPDSIHDNIISTELIGNNQPFTSDSIIENSENYPECGNLSVYRLFRFFPSSCQDFILGSDYFFIDVAACTGLNICYHNRAVIHQYTSERKANNIRIYNYWKGFLMLIDSQTYYHKFYESYLIGKKIELANSESNWSDSFIKNMKLCLKSFNNEFYEERKRKLLDSISILSQTQDNGILKSLDILSSEIDYIIDCTDIAIRQHIKLLKEWNNIVSVIDSIRSSNDVNNYLDAFIRHAN